MISDTLHNAIEEMRDYLSDPAFAEYNEEPLRTEILDCMRVMDALLTKLDTPPNEVVSPNRPFDR